MRTIEEVRLKVENNLQSGEFVLINYWKHFNKRERMERRHYLDALNDILNYIDGKDEEYEVVDDVALPF